MINAWSLAWEVLNGTMDETYPEIDDKTGLWKEPQPYPYDNYECDDLDYEIDLSAVDDQYAHHFAPKEKEMAHYFKYHEEEILKDIEEYVSGTYKGHYTGNSHEYRNVQTLDLLSLIHI